MKNSIGYPLVVLLLSINLFLFSCGQERGQSSDAPPEELSEAEKRKIENALAGLDIADGLEISLLAAEPMLINPTNIDVDEKGRVWVCEAYNYRPNLNAGNDTKPEGDQIVILEDTDGDGQADNSKVFYQGNDINAALGIVVFPSAGINFGYEGYVLTLKDQNKDVGCIVSRTEQTIDLRKMGEITTTYQRKDITSIEALENSLMIDGLTNTMSEQELVDLVSYMESLKKT